MLLPRVPRSRHCRFCRGCIEKYDHHCIWYNIYIYIYRINGCVGAKNYKYFLLFLFTHSIMCGHISYMGSEMILNVVNRDHLFETRYTSRMTGEEIEASYGIVFSYLVNKYAPLIFVVVLCISMAIALPLFSIYHCKLAYYNQTTNETIKTSDLKDMYKKNMVVCKREIKSYKLRIDKLGEISHEDLKSVQNEKSEVNGEKEVDNLPELESKIEELLGEIEYDQKCLNRLNKSPYSKPLKHTIREIVHA